MSRQLDHIVANLMTRRIVLGITQADIATSIGVSDETVSTWETRRKQPTVTNLMAWIKLLGLRIKPVTEDQP
jgi:DNA-binding XRE family transcriptional regulator